MGPKIHNEYTPLRPITFFLLAAAFMVAVIWSCTACNDFGSAKYRDAGTTPPRFGAASALSCMYMQQRVQVCYDGPACINGAGSFCEGLINTDLGRRLYTDLVGCVLRSGCNSVFGVYSAQLTDGYPIWRQEQADCVSLVTSILDSNGCGRQAQLLLADG